MSNEMDNALLCLSLPLKNRHSIRLNFRQFNRLKNRQPNNMAEMSSVSLCATSYNPKGLIIESGDCSTFRSTLHDVLSDTSITKGSTK